MPDTLMKPIELAVPAGEVGHDTTRRTNQPVRRIIVGPLNLHPTPRISPGSRILPEARHRHRIG